MIRLPALVALLVTFALSPMACAASKDAIVVSEAWARPTIGSSTQGVIYLTITNKGSASDTLTTASTPAAGKVEFHAMDMSGGMMKMRAMPSVAIAAGESIEFSPGGNHIMLEDVTSPLKTGDTIELTLTFEKAGNVIVQVPVKNGD
jgi:hypothetical protein